MKFDMKQKFEKLHTQIGQVLDQLIGPEMKCALIDFPNYGNVGDSAIWLGEVAYLAGRKCDIRYVCDSTNYNREALKAAVGSNTILINGGGNFGDLYVRHQKLREQVVADFPGNRIIQLPQSIHFSSVESLARSSAQLSKHPDFHLIVRDKASYQIARQHFSCPTYLCPDMALMLDLKPYASMPKSTDIVVLSRTDKEKAAPMNLPPGLVYRTEVVDWLAEPIPRHQRLYDWAQARLKWNSKVPRALLNRIALYAANGMARQRLERGRRLLGQGNVLVTDRLHALVLGWLGKTRVFYVDNNYRKLANVVECWIDDPEMLKQCKDFGDAIGQASNYLDRIDD